MGWFPCRALKKPNILLEEGLFKQFAEGKFPTGEQGCVERIRRFSAYSWESAQAIDELTKAPQLLLEFGIP